MELFLKSLFSHILSHVAWSNGHYTTSCGTSKTLSPLPSHLIHSYLLIATNSITSTSSLSKSPPNLVLKKLLA